jgi:hypothetical protein
MPQRFANKLVCLLYLPEGHPELAILLPHPDLTVTPQKQNRSRLWPLKYPLVV